MVFKRPNNQTATCKVNLPILAICYLEVLLWSFCLLASCAVVPVAGEELCCTCYLQREKGNLGLAATAHVERVDSPPHVEAACLELAQRLEHGCIQKLQDSVAFATPEVLQPGLTTLRIFKEVSGLPAPYTGIKAIS